MPLSIAAIGPLSLVGAAIAGPLTARFGLGPAMIGALLFEALSRLLLPFATGAPVQAAVILAASQALLGLTVPLWTVSSISLTQSVAPERLLGRVNAAHALRGRAHRDRGVLLSAPVAGTPVQAGRCRIAPWLRSRPTLRR